VPALSASQLKHVLERQTTLAAERSELLRKRLDEKYANGDPRGKIQASVGTAPLRSKQLQDQVHRLHDEAIQRWATQQLDLRRKYHSERQSKKLSRTQLDEHLENMTKSQGSSRQLLLEKYLPEPPRHKFTAAEQNTLVYRLTQATDENTRKEVEETWAKYAGPEIPRPVIKRSEDEIREFIDRHSKPIKGPRFNTIPITAVMHGL
jgi:hypothetical protein